MRRVFHARMLLLTAASLLASCGQQAPPLTSKTNSARPAGQGTTAPQVMYRPGEKPVPPLELAAPAPLPAELDGKDLRTMSGPQLMHLARQAGARGDYRRAAPLQQWGVEKTKTGQYDLACYLARIGKIDDAFYWLQKAALEEGVDRFYAERDEDLVSVRADPRYAQLREYFAACNAYFETMPGKTEVILPTGYDGKKPITVVVWLHGLNSNPENFVDANCQPLADRMNVAFVGASGTLRRGPRKFAWAEDPQKDAARVRAALAEVRTRLTIKPGHVITFGFSQGAQVGLEVAVRAPAEFAGAIVLSPGAIPRLNEVKASPELSRCAFVVACGAREAPGNVRLAEEDADWLRNAGAQVQYQASPGQQAHSFPPDFGERFPEWVKFIDQSRKE